jgi:hypothetical protein
MPDKLLIATEDYETAYEELDDIYRFAIDFRIDGMRYRAIAQIISKQFESSRTEQRVKEWFSPKDGMLYDIYQWKKRQRREESKKLFKNVHKQLQDAAVDAAVTLKNKSRMGDVAAALGVLRIAGFEMPTKVEHSQDPDRPIFYLPENGRDKKDH